MPSNSTDVALRSLAVLLRLWLIATFGGALVLRAEVRKANPANYRGLLRTLKPGDTLKLAPGKYPTLPISNLRGEPDAWITITGPPSDTPAIIEGSRNSNTVEIMNCSYVAIESLRIDSRGIPGAFGISARGRENNLTHHIRIEDNILVGQNNGQQTDGISTKTPTWGWVIRYNRILGAGTGIYLGDSDGTQPFVAGLIENNLIKNTIGYNMEIKDQTSLPAIPGMPLEPTSTIIRNNVFMKDDHESPDGDRPNLLVGAFPAAGAGSLNTYEIYGNYLVHNHREALFQGSGRITLHDNVFLDGPYDYPAVVLMKQVYPLKMALVYHNTVYTSGPGIRIGSAVQGVAAIIGNLIFAATPISGTPVQTSDNITASIDSAPKHVRAPSLDPDMADFYPLPGRCQGAPIDLGLFQSDVDYTLDFNGTPKIQSKGTVAFRGAYAGEGDNPGWHLQTDVKPPSPPRAGSPVRLVSVSPAGASTQSSVKLTLIGTDFDAKSVVTVEGDGVRVTKVTVDSPTQISATLTIAPGATAGIRNIAVTTLSGTSNSLKFRVVPGRR